MGEQGNRRRWGGYEEAKKNQGSNECDQSVMRGECECAFVCFRLRSPPRQSESNTASDPLGGSQTLDYAGQARQQELASEDAVITLDGSD